MSGIPVSGGNAPGLSESRVGIVTVTYNSESVIRQFMKCLANQTRSDFICVIVDNASHDQTTAVIEQCRDARTVLVKNSSNVGVAAANNQGIEYCQRAGVEWLLLINNDTEFDAGLIDSLIEGARTLRARVIVPRIVYFGRPDRYWFDGCRISWLRGFQARHVERAHRDDPRRIPCATTCCMLLHTSVIEDVGFMDPAYFVYWDDTDYCWRLREARIGIYIDPSIKVAHKVSTLTGGQLTPFSVRHYNRNQIYFLRKHFPARVVWANIILVRAKNIVRRLVGLDDSVVAGLRREAIREGISMPIGGRSHEGEASTSTG